MDYLWLSLRRKITLSLNSSRFRMLDINTGRVLLVGQSKGDLYPIPTGESGSILGLIGERASSDIWHGRL